MRTQTVRCPEFPAGLTWLNTPRPLTVAGDLRGRVSVLDFWTYCCINCMHVLPVLKRIEARFASQPVAVIGVHSAKFISERDPLNIRRAMERYGVAHPVVVDPDHDIWQRFSVKAWPTLVLVDAEGYVRETLPGEADEASLATRIEKLVKEARDKGVLAVAPISTTPARAAESSESSELGAHASLLRFPGRLHAHGDRLFVSDSGHNRIVITDLHGGVQDVVGRGDEGAQDGEASQATFRNPQGLAVVGGSLYVADTGNHLLRAVDLETLQVATVAGTASLGGEPGSHDPREPLSVPLRSPWGLLPMGTHLLVAMAGSHQIWVYDPDKRVMAPWAGSGEEEHIDAPLREAAFAQPSGLAVAGRYLLVADSEVSSVRAIDLEDGAVRTIVGRGLFDFGDAEGAPDEVLLQHPLDVAADTNVLYVADTYNNKVKAISFGTMQTRTIFGDGDPAKMHEPGGLAVVEGVVLIADTNNHRILKGDPETGRLSEFTITQGSPS